MNPFDTSDWKGYVYDIIFRCALSERLYFACRVFYLRYAVSYRHLEEIMEERGVTVDHVTLNRWVIKFSPLIASEVQRRKSRTSSSWRMDEAYIKVKGQWVHYYRAIDKFGKNLHFSLRYFGWN
jgi:transposase-like protein